MPFTVVSFHAHPDDEALLTGGTLAAAAAAGHRVVLVVATDGEAGLSEPTSGRLGAVRAAELQRSAAALSVARVVLLGHSDSGLDAGRASPGAFCRLRPEAVARELAEILRDERADVLTVYDSNGGYGHPDHRQVHDAGLIAARWAGTPVVLEATVDRDAFRPLVRLLGLLPFRVGDVTRRSLLAAYTPRDRITHVIDVGPQLEAKLDALRAHRSQATGGRGPRTVALLLRAPGPVRRRLLGREWFVEVGRPPGAPVGDVFATLRDGAAGPPGLTGPAARRGRARWRVRARLGENPMTQAL
ncbi:PIG-L deacetylase family protein [Spongisporangium articulatum]|uniref:PIG-L deacetylase family protein n=1 Tax=Spongisporangium articulatum TaxID=3362603 RepID=A0ABW8AS18_9ACTN